MFRPVDFNVTRVLLAARTFAHPPPYVFISDSCPIELAQFALSVRKYRDHCLTVGMPAGQAVRCCGHPVQVDRGLHFCAHCPPRRDDQRHEVQADGTFCCSPFHCAWILMRNHLACSDHLFRLCLAFCSLCHAHSLVACTCEICALLTPAISWLQLVGRCWRRRCPRRSGGRVRQDVRPGVTARSARPRLDCGGRIIATLPWP